MRVELDADGRIAELTAFFRPMPGLAALAAALAPRVVVRRQGRLRATVARLAMAPIALLTRIGDVFIPWFARQVRIPDQT
jgi:hypothetical protein